MTNPIKSSAGFVNKILLDLYKPKFQEIFKNHPKGSEIVESLCKGDNAPELIELWFAESEMHNWQKLMEMGNRGAERQGDTVTFEIHKGD